MVAWMKRRYPIRGMWLIAMLLLVLSGMAPHVLSFAALAAAGGLILWNSKLNRDERREWRERREHGTA